MELYKGVHQIDSIYFGRHLFQYLFVGERLALVDSGIASTPEKFIFPYIDKLQVDPARLGIIITTHPDLDHQGGNAALRKHLPSTVFACGEADRRLVEDPAVLYSSRYNSLKQEHGLGFDDLPSPDAGEACRVDFGFRGGETVVLSPDWDLEVLCVPGHSSGHLALFDRRTKAAFVSDAVHGRGCPEASGAVACPVTYFKVESYLSTIQYLEALKPEALHTGHWPSMYGDEISDFFSESRSTVDAVMRRILKALERTRTGMTLKELLEEVGEEFPEWPKETLELAMFPVKGHLEQLEANGLIRTRHTGWPPRWEAT